MNLCRCERGHFYDKEKYASCPHCTGGSASDERLTEAFTEDYTVPVPAAAPPVTPVAPPVTPVAPSIPPVVPPVTPVAPAPVGGGLPVAGIPANQMTVAMGVANGDTPTVPLEDPVFQNKNVPPLQNINSNIPGGSEDSDDHTIGFFDDVFSTAADTGSKSAAPAPVNTPVVNKVSTPCVGWLIALGGEHIGTDFRLKVGKNFIGRSPQMDVALTNDKSVSRDRHAIVVYEPKAHIYLVQPGESSSLVYRNDEVVLTPMKLEAYDMITVGDVNLLFMPLCGERFNWGDLLEAMKKKDR